MRNIIVTDQVDLWGFLSDKIEVIATSDYLINKEMYNDPALRVINLCRNYDYQSLGYYVSLLAEARGQEIFPSVMAIQDIKAATSRAIIDATIHDEIQHDLQNIKANEFEMSLYFGRNMAKKYNTLAAKIHGIFPIPLFQITFARKKEWLVQKIRILSISEIPAAHQDFFEAAAKEYCSRKQFYFPRVKNYLYDVAILVNDQDKTAPSDKDAIELFVAAGDKLGMNVIPVKKEDIRSVSDYDGLFIRETTSIMHWTYKLARRAQAEGMVVIDDPVSMLRCTNKVYLAELLKQNNIPVPETKILHRHLQSLQLPHIEYPCVLKRPDGSSSQGVVKVHDPDELKHHANHYFKDSDLIIAQNFLPTEFDWRIGILDNQIIFACQYFMVEDNWKILQWDEEEMQYGKFTTVDPAQVPAHVSQTALQAAALIGDGLYGVDLKQIGDKVYVIEINDNPNIEHEVEDIFAGDQLYTNVMQTFFQRLKARHMHVH